MAVSTLFPQECFGCQGFSHVKHECPTYLKSIGKSKALAATLSDTQPEDDSDNEDDRILNAFTATVNPTNGIVKEVVEEEELVESKFKNVRLILSTILLALFRTKFDYILAISNPIFRWDSCKGSE